MMTEQFFTFLRNRESIRLAKESGAPRDTWTDDPILSAYKFTNVKREHDWTTRKLMNEFYNSATLARPTELLVNCTIARFFGLAETVCEIGWSSGGIEHTIEHIRKVVDARFSRGDSVFTGAYIVPNCGDSRPKHEIVIDVVRAVHEEFGGGPQPWFHPGLTLQEIVKRITTINGFGSFMAKEVLLDFCLAASWEPADWETWTPVGPGARRGAARVKNDGSLYPELKEKAAFEVIRELYKTLQNSQPGDLWPGDWVSLSLCDIQFQLCEFDKYMRAARNEGKPKSRYSPRQVK